MTTVPLSECRSPILKLATYFHVQIQKCLALVFRSGGGAAGRDLSCAVLP